MKKFIAFFLLSITPLFLSGCASGPETVASAGKVDEPGDNMVDAAVQDYMKSIHGPLYSQYDYTRADLDGDGRRDALVMFSGPHNYWCNGNGCSLAVFKAKEDHFELNSKIFPVRGPLYISDSRSEGWKNLVVHVAGISYLEAKNVALQFDGSGYPINPILQPPILLSQADTRQRVFP